MKLVKYLLYIIFLVVSLVFIINLMEENNEEFIRDTFYKTNIGKDSGNQPDSLDYSVDQVMVKIPFTDSNSSGIKVWIFFLAVLTCGVVLGFFIALVQIVSQKREIIYQRSKLKKMQTELDTLRNQNIDENLILSDELVDDSDSETSAD